MVMRKTAKTRRRATRKKTAPKSGRGSVKSTARKAGARTAGKGAAAGKKPPALRAARPLPAPRPQPATRKPEPVRTAVLEATRGGVSPEPSRAQLSVTVVEAVPGTCLSLKAATRIVLRAANNFPGDMDTPLERAGFITEPQRAVFRQRVFEGVLEGGGHLSAGAIPNGPNTLLSEVRDAIQAQAS